MVLAAHLLIALQQLQRLQLQIVKGQKLQLCLLLADIFIQLLQHGLPVLHDDNSVFYKLLLPQLATQSTDI